MILVKKYWPLIAAVIIILLLRACDNPMTRMLRGHTISSDTTEVYIEGKERIVYDTIKDVVYRDFHHYHTDTVYNTDSTDWSVGYIYEKKDSIIDATIDVYAKERPDSVVFRYSALIPTKYRIDTVSREITIKERVNQLWFGGSVSPSHVGVGLDLVHKKGWQAEAGVLYDFSNNSFMPMIGYKQLISFRKK